MRVILFFAMCLLASNSYASDILFLQQSNADALKLAKKLDKPFFVYFSGSWCPTCRLMEEHTFTDDNVADYASQNFLAFKVNIDTPDGKEWKENHGVYAIPTLIFFDKFGVQQDLHASTISATGFLEVMRRNADFARTSAAPSTQITPSFSTTVNSTIPIGYPAIAPVDTPSTETSSSVVNMDTSDDNRTITKDQTNLLTETLDEEIDSELENRKYNNVVLDENLEVPNEIQSPNVPDFNTQQITAIAATPAKKSSIVATPGSIWIPTKNRKKKARDKIEIADASEVEVPSIEKEIIEMENSIKESMKELVEEKIADPIDATDATNSVSETTPAENNNGVTENTTPTIISEKPPRPKRKTLVLNPKKETSPTNIVIRTERIDSPSTTSSISQSSSGPAKVLSMATNKANTSANSTISSNSIPGTTSYLQLGVFENQSNASTLLSKVRQQFYYDVSMTETYVDGKRVFRVTMNGFQTKDQVVQTKSQLKAAGFKSFIFDN